MITYTTQKEVTRFSSADGKTFKVIAKYNPNEEDDLWVEYVNERTSQKYSCRMEAFLARFSPIVD
jgi:hypothetical protein